MYLKFLNVGVESNEDVYLSFEVLKKMERECESQCGSQTLNLDQFVDQTVDSLHRVIPSVQKNKNVFVAREKL